MKSNKDIIQIELSIYDLTEIVTALSFAKYVKKETVQNIIGKINRQLENSSYPLL